ncbi:MAG: hypothetical protein V4773_27365, partial [Verrucomicrobiota bacterium]
LQQAASAGANVLAGLIVITSADGHLLRIPLLGYTAVGFFMLTVILAAQLRAAAPHVSMPMRKTPPPAPVSEAAA